MSRHAPSLDVRLKRAYERPSSRDGVRILVDRLWPRGLHREGAAIERWMKDIAPSSELRRWFGHDPARWEEFARRYRAELSGNSSLVDELRGIASRRPLTLVYAARDEAHNQAVVLREVLLEGRRAQRGGSAKTRGARGARARASGS
jgi:uncharacterized protein YeaO (DUF488 family)